MRLLLIIILFPSLLLGQDSTSTDHSFSFNFGVNVDVYFGNRYSPPDPKAAPDGGVFGGSTGHSVFSFEGGGYYSYSITKYLFIQAGIQYFNRKGYSTSNPDSVIKYTPNSPYWKPTIERKYSDHNIDIPLLMGINYKRFSILAGIRSNVISYKITELIYLNGEEEKSASFSGFDWASSLSPEIILRYLIINNSKVPIGIYMGIIKRAPKYYDLSFGVDIYFF